MDRRLTIVASYIALIIGPAASCPGLAMGESAKRELGIYLIDVEGGGATLIVTPSRQAILIDAGWNTENFRDSKRVLAAARRAGVDHLDYLIVTHYHSDHLGGVVELAPHISIGEFLDHGLMQKPLPYVSTDLYVRYLELSKGRRHEVRPGERIVLRADLSGLAPSLLVLASNGLTYRSPGGEPNPACADAQSGPTDSGENANSVAVLLQFGNFRYLAGADLPWKQEMELVCPSNQIGRVNVYQVDHHGKNTSNNPVLLDSIHAQAALMNNGSDKGGDAFVFEALRKFMNVHDIYQIHRNLRTSDEENAPPENVANSREIDGGFGFEIHVHADGESYELINTRTREVREYAASR